MMPVLFYVGSLPIYSFGVLVSLAFVVAGYVMQRDFARKREPRDLAWEIVGFGLVGGALFAIYLVLSALTRLLVEVVRTNRPILLGLTEAQ